MHIADHELLNLQVDRMVKDAEKFSDEDKKQREAVDIRNAVRLLCQGMFRLSRVFPCLVKCTCMKHVAPPVHIVPGALGEHCCKWN